MKRSVPIVCCAICWLALQSSQASVAGLAESSDAVVVGSVDAEIARLLPSHPSHVHATVHVSRVLKGPLSRGAVLTLSWPGARRPFEARAPRWKARSHGVFFLSREPDGQWSVHPVESGGPMWEAAFLPVPPETPPGIRAAILASLPARPSVVDTVLAEAVIALESSAQINTNLIEEFRLSKSRFLESAFVRFQSNQDPHIRNLGIRGSLAAGDVGTLLAIQREHRTLASGDSLWQRLLDALRLFVNTERRAVWSLGLMASDTRSRIDLRSAAASALARMHTRDMLPLLAALLDDPSDELRAIACGGIARFANNLPMDSHQPASRYSPYRTWDTIIHATFESEHTPFWKAWWSQHKAELTK